VCAPSGPVDPDAFSTGLEVLKSRYEVQVSPSLISRKIRYLAGDDRTRLRELTSALLDPQIRAVFCARGGYGAMRIIDYLPLDQISENPKPVVGFSDITALLLTLQLKGIVGIHGPVVTQMGVLPLSDLAHLWRLLEDPDYRPIYESSGSGTHSEQQPQESYDGVLWGGNLAMLASSVGSFSPKNLPERGLLLIEEVAEPPYKIDRMLTQLARAGFLANVKAVALGEMSASNRGKRFSDDNSIKTSQAMEDTLCEVLNQLGLPWVTGFGWGHGNTNPAWPMGVRGSLCPLEKQLTIHEPTVIR